MAAVPLADPRLGKSSYEVETALLIRKAGKRRDMVNTGVWGRRSSLSPTRSLRRGGRERRRAGSAVPVRTKVGSQAEQSEEDAAREAYLGFLRVNVGMRVDFPPPERALWDEVDREDIFFKRVKSCPADSRPPKEEEVYQEEDGEGPVLRRRCSMMGAESESAYETLATELGIQEERMTRARAMGGTIADALVEGMSYMDFLRPFTTAAFAVGNSRRRSVYESQLSEAEKKKQAVLESVSVVVDLSRRNLTLIPLEAFLLLGPFVNRLKFSRNRISQVPDQLGRWSSLQSLALDYNQITSLPRSFGLHVSASLTDLNASNNELSALPDSFKLLSSLTQLLLSGNKFTAVPSQISSCFSLKKLALRSCSIAEASALGALSALTACALNKNPPLKSLPIELGSCVNVTVLDFDPVFFPPEEIWSLGLPHLMGHLGLLLAARRTHDASLSGLHLRSLADAVCREAHLTRLDVSHNHLTSLPHTISALASLRTLSVARNQLTGASAVPLEIGELTSLTLLDVSSNKISLLPPTLGHLASLTSLDVSDNAIPALPLSSRLLSSLTCLSLASNPFSQPPPDVAAAGARACILYMRALHSLIVGSHVNMSRSGMQYFPLALVQPIPRRLFLPLGLPDHSERAGMAAGERISRDGGGTGGKGDAGGDDGLHPPPVLFLALDMNGLRSLPEANKGTYLTGHVLGKGLSVVPSGLAQFTSITSLSVSGNRLTAVPAHIGCLKMLTRANFDNNLICEWVDNREYPVSGMTCLTSFSLGDNQLTILPEPVRDIVALKALCFDSNFIRGLPAWLENATTLTSLSVNNNRLGSLPTVLGRLKQLRELQLCGNALSDLPIELFTLTNLTRLRLSRNMIQYLPRDVARLKCLVEMSVGDNCLRTLPASLSTMPGLKSLRIEGNISLFPSLPPQIVERSTEDLKRFLRRIHVSGKTLDLTEQGLEELPLAVMDQHEVQTLILRRNHLTTLPPEIVSLKSLKSIDIAHNDFQELPEALLGIPCLTDLKITGNPLPHVPKEILQQGSMQVIEMMRRVRASRVTDRLDLNKLGLHTLPAFALDLGYVSDLNIDYNSVASLPESLCWSLPCLTRLSARGNQLASPLPLRLGMLTQLTSIDVAQNRLVSLPIGIALLTRLRTLATASNPLALPSSALLSKGLPTVMKVIGGICDMGVGMRLTQHIPDGGGGLQRFERPEEGKEGGGECVLIHNGIRRAMGLVEAAKVAEKGAMILVRPGVYDKVLVFSTEGVTVGGDGACNDCILRVKGDPDSGHPPCAVVCRAYGCRLINMTVEYVGTDRSSSAVLVQAGSLAVLNCDIHNGVGIGVMVRRGMDATLVANRIHGCYGIGVDLEQDVHSEIKYNDIIRSGGAGIRVSEGANPLIESNRIVKGKASGVLAVVGGKGIVRANEFLMNAKAGVEIRTGANPVVERNRLAKNLIGVLCAEGGKGMLLDNVLTDSVSVGISIMSQACPEVSGNRLNGAGSSTGVLLLESAMCAISDTEVQGMQIGIVASEGSRCALLRSRVFHMSAGGMVFRGKGTKVSCNESEVFGNNAAGIEVTEGATAVLVENMVKNNGGAGVLVQRECHGSMVRNTIVENTGGKVISHSHERKFVVG